MNEEMSMLEMLESLKSGGRSGRSTPPTSQEVTAHITALVNARTLLVEPRNYKEGDLVKFKPGLQNKATLKEYPGIVIRFLDEPIFDKDDTAGSPYFREPLDVIVASMEQGHEGTMSLVEFYLDSRRLEVFVPETNFGRGN